MAKTASLRFPPIFHGLIFISIVLMMSSQGSDLNLVCKDYCEISYWAKLLTFQAHGKTFWGDAYKCACCYQAD
ncbi:hypothetical protein MKX01_026702 [Papaver californicum]|nr:hypothetical protein MKX01_026702 [Papaver californicum]